MEELKKDGKITSFFSKVKTVSAVSDKQDFYQNCLDKKLKETSCCSQCEGKKVELKRILEEEKSKLQNIEKALSSCLYMIEKKDKKIELLSKELDKKEESNIDNVAYTTPEKKSDSSINNHSKIIAPEKEPFESYAHIFPADVLAEMRSKNAEISTDSTFVLIVMRSLYKDDLETLKGTSVTGQSKKDKSKKPMSPSNVKIIRGIFEERLTAMKLQKGPKDVRMKRLNILIKSAINNIINKAKKTENELTLFT